MAVHVVVDATIANGTARRRLDIELIGRPKYETGISSVHDQRVLDEVNEYSVVLEGRHPGLRTTFKHRYGDDVFVLIQKAVEALRLIDPKL